MRRKLKIYQCEKCDKKFIPTALDQSNGVRNECIYHNNRLDYIKGIVVFISFLIAVIVLGYIATTFIGVWTYPTLIVAYLIYKVYARFSNGAAL